LERLEIWGQWLQTSPADFLVYLVMLLATVLLSLTLHECAHGYMAYRCGDPTAKMLGRLSLNPLKHIDPIGGLCLLLLGFGWAKPVPVNPRNFNDYRRDDFMVSIAGIVVNLTLFIISTALMVAISSFVWSEGAIASYGIKELLSIYPDTVVLKLVNPDMDYFFDWFLKSKPLGYVMQFLSMFASINLGLGLFNLLPMPPLDGYHVVNDIFLKGRFQLSQRAFQIAHMVVLVLCFSGAVSKVLGVMMDAVNSGVLNLFLSMTGKG